MLTLSVEVCAAASLIVTVEFRLHALYFFSPSVKLVTTVTDWLTCWERRSSRSFWPSLEMSKNGTVRMVQHGTRI